MKTEHYNSADYRLSKSHTTFFTKLEEEVGQGEFLVSYGAFKKKERPFAKVKDDDQIVIYDCSTPFTEGSPARGFSYFYDDTGENLLELTTRYTPGRQGFQGPNGTKPPLDYEGVYLKYDNSPVVVALVGYRTVWLLYALKNFAGSKAEYWLGEVVKKAVKMSLNKELFSDREKAAHERAKTEFLNYMRRASQAEVQQNERAVQQAEGQLGAMQAQQIQVNQALIQARNRLAYAESVLSRDDMFYQDQLKQLTEHRDFEDLAYNEATGEISVKTKQLYLHSPNRKERTILGEFRVHFNVQTRTVRMENLTLARGGRAHPHIPNKDGSGTCWGSAQAPITKLAAAGEVIPLFEMCITFLETYNPADGWGGYANNWFNHKDAVKQKLREDGVYRSDEEQKKYEEGDKTEEKTEATEKEVIKEEKTGTTVLTEQDILGNLATTEQGA